MKVTLKDGYSSTKEIHVDSEGKTLEIMFMENLDLYWVLDNHDKNNLIKSETFTISKKNYSLYEAFLTMFNDIATLNIYNHEIEFPPYVETKEEIKEYLEMRKEELEYYRTRNLSHYQDLYNENDKTITWYSDEINMEVGNYVVIKKLEEKFILEFKTQEPKDGYDKEFNLNGRVAIRFRSSGSIYDPFNIVFMRMYKKLQLISHRRIFVQKQNIKTKIVSVILFTNTIYYRT